MYIYIFYNLKSNRNDSTWVFPWWCSNFLDDHPPSNSLRSTWKGKRKSELSLSLFISLVLLGMYSGSPRQEIPLIAKCHMPTKMMASQDQMTCPWLFIARQIWPFISPLYHQDQLPPVHCQKLQDARAGVHVWILMRSSSCMPYNTLRFHATECETNQKQSDVKSEKLCDMSTNHAKHFRYVVIES